MDNVNNLKATWRTARDSFFKKKKDASVKPELLEAYTKWPLFNALRYFSLFEITVTFGNRTSPNLGYRASIKMVSSS